DFDLFVIGAGSGGVRAARIAAAYGAKVAIAEEHKVGGTCVIRGCVPKKLLVYGAHFAEDLNDATMFGWDIPNCSFSWPVLRGYDEQLRDRLLQISLSKGIDFRFNSMFEKIEKHEDGSLLLTMKGCDNIEADAVLFATGRNPNIEGLGCEAAGVAVGEKGEI